MLHRLSWLRSIRVILSLMFLTVCSFQEPGELIFTTPFVYLLLTLVHFKLKVQQGRPGTGDQLAVRRQAPTQKAPYPTSANAANLN